MALADSATAPGARAASEAFSRSFSTRPIISLTIWSWLISRFCKRAGKHAVAQHDDAVGDALDLVQAVRDEDDADAVGLQRR